jgi:DNA-binding transcriptional MerR regulator
MMFQTFLNRSVLEHVWPDMPKQFTSREVVTLTGVTARQLQWWDERGVIVPARSGHRRLYSLEELTEVAVIRELLDKGFSLRRVRKVIRFLQREFGKRLAETVSGTSGYHLLTDGRSLYLETSARQIVDILKNSRQPMLAICLSDTVRQVRAVIRSGKKASKSAATARVSQKGNSQERRKAS